jgi:glutamine synthetase
VAPRHGLQALLHEKPFAGVNGSGKHNNWSLSTDTGVNLLDPRDETHTNLQFLVFLCAVIRAVDLHADLLRASIASAATTTASAPTRPRPRSSRSSSATCSVTSSTSSKPANPKRTLRGGTIDLGARSLPQIPRHSGDRNRTSPLRLHRQQVRVPCRRQLGQHRLAQYRPEHGHRRSSSWSSSPS